MKTAWDEKCDQFYKHTVIDNGMTLKEAGSLLDMAIEQVNKNPHDKHCQENYMLCGDRYLRLKYKKKYWAKKLTNKESKQ